MNDLDHDNGNASEEVTTIKASREEQQWKERGKGGIMVNREFHRRDNVV